MEVDSAATEVAIISLQPADDHLFACHSGSQWLIAPITTHPDMGDISCSEIAMVGLPSPCNLMPLGCDIVFISVAEVSSSLLTIIADCYSKIFVLM